MVTTKHTLGARLDQRLVVRGYSYGALNFNPENSSTKVNDHHYKIFLGNPVSAQSEQIHSYGGEAAKFVHCNGFSRCDWIGSYVVTLNQPKLWDTGGK